MAPAHLGILLRQLHQHTGCPAQPSDRQLLDDFVAGHSEAAFATLLARHGRMVLRVCQRVLGHEQDAEDAFQATFLVLARNRGSIRQRDALGPWLYGVAYRTAMAAKRSAARRRNREARLRSQAPRPVASPTWDDVQAVLDEEIQRLPEAFRQAFVLCVLEGKSGPEAARELGVREGTVASRLTRARRRLQAQLARRGIKLAALLAALSVAENAGRSALPAVLTRATLRSGLHLAAGLSSADAIPPHVAALAAGVTRAMFLTKARIAGLVLLVLSLVATGAGLLVCPAPAGDRPAESPEPRVSGQDSAPTGPKQSATPETHDHPLVRGRVLDPSGKPVAGAKLFLCDHAGKSAAPQPATGDDGRFRFALAETTDPGARFLVATADGLGLDWAYLRPMQSAQEVTLRLPVDVPIRGQVVDLEAKPVAGAVVRIAELSTTESGTLDEFLKRWAADREKSPVGPAFHLLTEKRLWLAEALRQLPTATTGPDGKFRLSGIGRDRGIMLGVRGRGIAEHYVRVVTRADFPARPSAGGRVALFGPEPTIVVAPSRPIHGTVRDAQTRQPLAGVHVLAYTPDRPIDWWWQRIDAVTDAQGRYHLDGLAKARQILAFDPGPGAAHMHRFDEIGDTPGFAPITHDAVLARGVVVHGRVTDRSTGRPVRARVVYCPLVSNGNYTSTPGYAVPQTRLALWVDSREMVTGADGRYRLTALPGPGALFVMATGGVAQYTQPSVPKQDRDAEVYDARAEVFITVGLGDIFPMSHINAYRLIRPNGDATELSVDFGLDPGVRKRGRLLDPDGRPLTGAEVFNLKSASGGKEVLPGAEFTVLALNPAKRRRLLFWHEQRKLAGTVVLKGDEPEPVTVTLQPLATLTGRAVRKNGEPLAGFPVEYSGWPDLQWPGNNKRFERDPIRTDKDGRFRIPNLPAGVPLSVSIFIPKTRYAFIHREKIILEPGKARDLGSLRGEPEEQ